MKRIPKKIAVIAVAASLVMAPLHGYAGWMEDFYSTAGAGANITAPAAIHTQNSSGFAGGGVSWRIPSTTINPVQITPPSIKAGCNGIDAFLGGYSFVNKAAFVQALRNFGQAAVGYFFQLALRSMAPEVAVTLDAINDIAQKVNQFGANSCQMAKLAVDSTAGKFFEENKREASGYAAAVGEFVDRFDSVLGMQTGGGSKIYQERYTQKYGKARAAITEAEVCATGAVDVNAVFWVMCNSKVNMTVDERNLIMSLMGADYIIKGTPDPDTDETPEADGHGPTLSIAELVGDSGVATASFTVLTCGNAECTNLVKASQTHRPFTAIVEDALDSIKLNITGRLATPLPAEAQTVLKLSSVPLWRAAGLATTSGLTASAANELTKDLAQYAALDAAVNFVNFYLDKMDRSIATSGDKLPAGLAEKKEALHRRVASIKREMTEYQAEAFVKRGNPWQKLDQLERIERAMFSNINQQLAANQRFGNRH